MSRQTYSAYALLHFVLPILLRLILLLKIALCFASPFDVTRVYLLLSCLDTTLQPSKSAVFTKVRQRSASLIYLFVQLCDSFANLLNLKAMPVDFRLELKNGLGAVLQPFAALVSYIPGSWSIGTPYRVRRTHRSMSLLEPSSLSTLLLSSLATSCA